ncbi:MAG: type IV pilus secretin PilQ [Elusimicrobia bacterium]|nr:type IV pilus secretin PilQ [Elusimicrobiota bacterium]
MINHQLKKALSAALAVVLAVPAGVIPAFAADAAPAPAVFQGVEIADDHVTIKLSTGVLYNSFLTQTPPRLVMELLDTKHEGPTQSAKGKGAFLAGVRSSQYEKSPRLITRVVMDLVKMAGYKVGTTAAGLTVQIVGTVDEAEKTALKAAAAPAGASAPKPAAVAAPKLPAVKPVVAKRAAAAAVAVPVVVTAPVAAPLPSTGHGTELAAPLPAVETKAKRRLNITAAQAMRRAGLDGTMSQELAASAQGSDVTKTKVDPAGEPDEDRVQRAPGGRIFRDIMSRLPRDIVTLDFDNTDIRDVIRLLAAKAKVNIVFGPDVAGSLTLHLTDVPFNEAFRTALSMMKLTTDQVGDNILRVITPAELTKQRTTSTAITKVYVLNYAKAAEVKATIDSVRVAEGRNGSSTADVKTNTLIVTDSLEGQLSTENLISQMDQRPRQVLIETKIVEINANAGLNYGVQWDYQGVQQGKIGGQMGTSLIGTTISPQKGSSPTLNPLDRNANITEGIGAGGRGTGVALAADRVFGALTLGRITNNFILNATLTAAASEGKAKILSEPKIATLNNQAANINVTTQIPYVTSNVASTGVQTQTVAYVTTGIQLTVTPSINADGRITLQVNPNVSQPSSTAAGSTQTGAPAVDSRNAMTTVLVRDGETIVIGGLITDTLQDTISKIPLLGDIPILGWLFKKKTKSRVRAELLIFVTTRILPD